MSSGRGPSRLTLLFREVERFETHRRIQELLGIPVSWVPWLVSHLSLELVTGQKRVNWEVGVGPDRSSMLKLPMKKCLDPSRSAKSLGVWFKFRKRLRDLSSVPGALCCPCCRDRALLVYPSM